MPETAMKIKITELYVYPIKSLRPISVLSTQLRREGLQYDRRFMLLKAEADGRYTNIQVSRFPECALFAQAFDGDGDHVVVTYLGEENVSPLRVPLDPATEDLEANGTVDILLFGSAAPTFRVGDEYDAWFTARLGYRAVLVYIGDNRRPVLAHAPPPPSPAFGGKSWFSSVASFLPSYLYQQPQQEKRTEDEGLTFNEAAPFLLTSRASLRDVSARMPGAKAEVDMIKFRPNIVVDKVPSSPSDHIEEISSVLGAWDEDYWGEIAVGPSHHRLALTANCARCVSVDIDYATGRRTDAVLKSMMRDRRVDAGNKWSPIFGRYAFLLPRPSAGGESSSNEGKGDALFAAVTADVAVGDEVEVTKRLSERDVWAWPK
ncbi:MOSC domain-containing protein [Hypoxylon cercidicola]|nr:MOSC domain-containing protein [Hypoxylon cercidicola]